MTQVLTEIFRTHPATDAIDEASLETHLRRANELYDSIWTYDAHLHRDVDLTEASDSFFAAAQEIEREYGVWIERNRHLYDHLSRIGQAARGHAEAVGFVKRFHRAQQRVQSTTADSVRVAREAKAGSRKPLQKAMDELLH